MKQHTINTYLLAHVWPGSTKIDYCVSENRMDSMDEYTVIGEKEVTFDVPEPAAETAAVVEGLEKKRDKMRAAANAAITEVDNQIASFLALENNNADS